MGLGLGLGLGVRKARNLSGLGRPPREGRRERGADVRPPYGAGSPCSAVQRFGRVCGVLCRVCSSSRGVPLQADERVEQDAAHRREECGERRLRHDLAQEVGSGLGLGLGLGL